MSSLRVLAPLLAAMLAPVAAAFSAGTASSSPLPRIDPPVSHENLSIYLLRGPSDNGPVPLTLAEAMKSGSLVVHETNSVNHLEIENIGSSAVFIQAGDIVKGGQQDRVLTVSLLVPSKSGKLPIGAFCVEQGRWAPRGKEDVARFASAEKVVPSRAAKLAMMAPATERPDTRRHNMPAGRIENRGPSADLATAAFRAQTQQRTTRGDETGSRQSQVWASVREVQDKLSKNIASKVAAPLSASSLQLSLENEKLAEIRAAYVTKLAALGTAGDDIIGVVFAVNGRISSGEVYPSNGLFRKMWPKLLEAGATEAIGEKDRARAAEPTLIAVEAFLAAAAGGKAHEAKLDAVQIRETREADAVLSVETRSKDGKILHRTYVAR